MQQPLKGVRVLDMSRLFPGPYCSLLLADLGADVVRVEGGGGGDFIRWLPPLLADGQSARFHALNRGKRSVGLDLKDDAHKPAFEQLVRSADVLLESFRPGVLERIGFGPDKLYALNPRLIVCRISGYGQDGPDRLRAGHDINYAARAGVLGMSARPNVLPVQVADLCGGAWPAAVQILAALYGRENSGEGAQIDVSMTDGAHAMNIMANADATAGVELSAGSDMLTGAVPCYGVYPTSDGWLSVGALEPKFWADFCRVTELESLLERGMDRGDEGDEVRGIIETKLAERSTAEWGELFGAADACVEPVNPPATAASDDAQLRVRRLRVRVQIGDDEVALPATPLSLGTPASEAAPEAGVHTREVLAGWGVEAGVIDAVVGTD